MNAAFFSIFQYFLVNWTPQGFRMAGAETLYATIGSDLIIKCPNDEVKSWQYPESKEIIADCESDTPKINPKLNVSDRFDVTSDCQLKIQNLTTSDLCIYFCTTYTSDSDYKIPVKLRNLKIHGINSYGLIHGTEGENLTLTCTVQGFLPGDTLYWTSNKKSLTSGNSHSLSYTLQANRSHNMNKFTCMVNNSNGTHSLKTRVQLNLLLTPDVSITLSINRKTDQKGKSVTVRQGKSINLRCRENYNASDDVEIFSWYFNGNVLGNNTDTIVLNKINHESSGQYSCMARNKAGNDSDTVNITVTYPPTVRNQTITFSESNRPRIIECEVSGEPDPHNYSWRHYTNNNQLVRNLKSSSDRNLILPEGDENDLLYEDSGVYVCNVTNGITDEDGQLWQTGQIKVIVAGKPALAKPQKLMYFGNFNGTSIISLFVLSSSNVLKAEWKIRNGETLGVYPCISAVNKTLIYGKEFAVSGYQCAYKIPNTQKQDFQNYTVDLRNKNGMESFEISLVSSRAPEVPDIIGVSQGQNSIVMDWRSNFDGGAPQSFIVQYRKHEVDKWTAVHIQTNKTKNSFYILNPQPNTKYVLRMLASNRLGNSSFTDPYIFHTDDEKKTVWIQSTIWFLSLAVFFPVCLVVILRRYRKARKTVPNNSSRRNSYPNQGVVNGNDINESPEGNDVYSSIDRRRQMLVELKVNYKATGLSTGRTKSDKENRNKRASKKRMNDPAKLNYIEIAFDPVTLKRELCIHGADNRTPYADIDFTAKADPMISSDESDTGSFLDENKENDFVSLEDVQQWNICSE